MPAWRINRESVSHELLNGEVIAIHLGTGIYYSLRGTAAEIWERLSTPVTLSALAEDMCASYPSATDRIGSDLGAFLERLQTENLVIDDAFEGSVVSVSAARGADYQSPTLERFADLQDLLLLDPIHEVGAQGWPQRPSGAAPERA